MSIDNETYESLNKYFSLLSKTGYKSYNHVYNLLALIFIEELLCGPLSEFVTREDYELITLSLECLHGSCFIPYNDYKRGIDDKIRTPNKCVPKHSIHIEQ